ncbi:MAG: Wadjet anti-phage system protein JetD domain-containing protein, partial [Chloroflexota bacterium]
LYWGDVDVQGFQILSALRKTFPHTRSILMDETTLSLFGQFKVIGTETTVATPLNLTMEERKLYHYLQEHNIRLEQEHISQPYVNQILQDTF